MFLNIGDHNLHVALYGSDCNPTLVLLHSLGTSHAVWQRQVRALRDQHFIIAPDFRGHGLSDLSCTPVTIEALADDVVSALTMLGVNAFHLAGISIGGLVAQCVAATLTDQVRALTLLDSNIVSLAPQMWKDRATKVRGEGLAAIEEAVLSRWTTEEGRATPEGRGLAVMLRRTPSEGYAAGCDALAVADCRHHAARLTMPVTVAVGEQDEATPPAAARALAEAITGARFEIIPGAAHIPLFEKADAVNTILQRSAGGT
ncbi:3-oxoadipate enol-lactonase [Rhizobium sp. BK275]|uniref:alpha/beta fold hydrolase n=1 Tax=Rhizobium sp. BK275 TaxID=2587077 RepID=UPI00160C6B48|nr:alpha/beta fold hydrolase [Rhizobium sp. BK275]MBB3388229.1 3-oxoadipate enol-lactonase [Rhizobium sp. BK275]